MGVDQGSGVRVLEDPLTNKGTAFSEEERSGLGLRGLLPAVVETLEQQVRRRYRAYQEQPTDVARHINLRALQDTNETLFYRLVSDHIEEMLPILYTPTVGLACQRSWTTPINTSTPPAGIGCTSPPASALSTTRLPSCAGARVASCSLPARSVTTSGTW
jgi:Malic enzyme, N-terminal domain